MALDGGKKIRIGLTAGEIKLFIDALDSAQVETSVEIKEQIAAHGVAASALLRDVLYITGRRGELIDRLKEATMSKEPQREKR